MMHTARPGSVPWTGRGRRFPWPWGRGPVLGFFGLSFAYSLRRGIFTFQVADV